MPNLPRIPSHSTLSYLLLVLTAVSGEYPTDQVIRLPGGVSYKQSLLTQLKQSKLLRTYYRNGLRGLRLTAAAKAMLLAGEPDRFRPYLTGDIETNVLKSEVTRRLRLHRMAEVLTTMFNADIAVFDWEKDRLFLPSATCPLDPILPSYYNSREVKSLGPQAAKIRGSRSAGVLLADDGIFIVYNTGPGMMKWEYRAEMRMKALIQTELCGHRLSSRFHSSAIHGLLFGSSMDVLLTLMPNTSACRRNYFILDGNFASFYYLVSDHRGEVILQLLCCPKRRAVLDSILLENLNPKKPGWTIEHDAVDEAGAPVIFAYTCDMPRIQRFDTALSLQDRTGVLICFDFQEPALRQICGPYVTIQSIDFEAYERSVFPLEEDSD